MVAQEEGGDGIGTLGRMVAHKTGHGCGETARIAALEGVAELVSEVELKAGGEPLVVSLLNAVTVPGLGNHKDVVRMSGGLVGGVAVVVPLAQQGYVGRIVVGAYAAADMLHRIQAEAVHAHVYPLVGRCGEVLEAGVILRHGDVAVVQVRHPVAEAAHIIKGLRRDVCKLYLVTAVAAEGNVHAVGYKVQGRTFLKRGISGLGAEFGTGVPVGILAHQHSPVAVYVHHKIIGAIALLKKLHGLVPHSVLPHVQVPAVGTVSHALRGLVDSELGRAACNLLPFSGIIRRSLEHGEILVIGRRIGAYEIVVPVLAGRVRQGLLEPGIVFSAVIQDIVHVYCYSLFMRRRKKLLEVRFCFFLSLLAHCIKGIQRIIVVHVIGVI